MRTALEAAPLPLLLPELPPVLLSELPPVLLPEPPPLAQKFWQTVKLYPPDEPVNATQQPVRPDSQVSSVLCMTTQGILAFRQKPS